MRRTTMSLFAAAAIAEAISWLALLTGMLVKYGPPQNEIGVKIFGPIHGGLFIAYVLLVVAVARLARWRWWITIVALVCAVPPFATLVFERWARRRRLLEPADAEPEPVSAR